MHNRSSRHKGGGGKASWLFGIEPSTLLLVLATGGLIVCDLARFTVPTVLAALALAVVVALYHTRGTTARLGIYAFIVAELSPISLNADVFTALIYQAFALLLLTAVIVPFPIMQTGGAYVRGLLITLLIAAAALVPAGIVLVTGTTVITAVQATALSVVVLGAMGGALIVIKRNYYRTLVGA